MEIKNLLNKKQNILILVNLIKICQEEYKKDNNVKSVSIKIGKLEIFATRHYIDRIIRILEAHDLAVKVHGGYYKDAEGFVLMRKSGLIIDVDKFLAEMKPYIKDLSSRYKVIMSQ